MSNVKVKWVPTRTGVGRVDGLGCVVDLSLIGSGKGYIPRVRSPEGKLVSLPSRETIGAAMAAVVRGYKPERKTEERDRISELLGMIQGLQREIQAFGGKIERQRKVVEVRRYEAVWRNLGAPNGYAHPSGRGRVVWNPASRRWEAYVDGRRLRKVYRRSFNARVAAGIKLSAS